MEQKKDYSKVKEKNYESEKKVQSEKAVNENPKPKKESSEKYIVKNVRLNIREQANADSKIVGVLPSGTEISVSVVCNGWAKIGSSYGNGFVMEKYISKK